MKTKWNRPSLYAAAWVAFTVAPGWCAEVDGFLNPPGAAWGRVLFTNFVSSRALAIERCTAGFVVAGEVKLPGDTLYDSALVAVLAADGTVIRSNVFLGLEYPEWGRLGCGASAVIPSYDTTGAPDGYVVAGYKHQHFAGTPEDPRPEWLNPTLWVMKTDLMLQPLWETNVAREVFAYGPALARWATSVVQTPQGYLVTGQAHADYLINPLDYDSGSLGLGCLLHLDRDGRVLELREAQQAGNEWLASGPKSIEPTSDGGYLLAIHDSVVKLDSARSLVWTNRQPVWNYDVKQSAAGGYLAAGRERVPDAPVPAYRNAALSSYSAAGALQWTSGFGRDATNDIGRALVAAPGACVIAGETDSMGAGGKDVWVIKTDSEGAKLWDIAIGGPGADVAHDVAMSADAQYVLAGEAQVGTNHWTWIVKVESGLHVPTAAFTVQPASPVFRDQVITFDASRSTNPGGSIAVCRWDFGDGTTNTGVTVQHSYSNVGVYDVTLEVLSADGPRSWATQEVEVAGLQIQWQRFYGGDTYGVSSIVEASDGGFVLAGGTGDSSVANAHLWVFKVDRRGLPVWEKFLDGPRSGVEYAHALGRGTDGGYVMAGSLYSSMTYDALLLKVNEDGEPAWPMKLFGETNGLSELARAIAPAADGGYFLAGENGSIRPMLIKTDADGNEVWTRHYEMENSRRADRVLATPDGGALFFARANGYRHWFIKTDPSGIPVWTNVLNYRETCYWLDHRQPPADGFVVVGTHYEDIWLSFLSTNGTPSGSQWWSGPAVYDQNDYAYGAAPTPDGGYVLTGSIWFQEETWGPHQNELVLLKTDPNGDRVWMETFPGTTNRNETGNAILALSDGNYVVLGDDGTSATPPVWLFKLARNHPPSPVMALATNVIATGETLTGDASGSSDRDGSVVGWEWDFGDGQTGSGASVSHAYTNAGAYDVRLTAVDDQDAERSVTNTVYVSGVTTGSGFTISDTSITNCPGCDPVNYPCEGVPLMIHWSNSVGSVITGTATSASTKTFRITFPDPVPEGLTLYRLPAWTATPYTVVDEHTIEVKFWLYAGSYVLPFVLGKTAPLPTVSALRLVGSQLSLTVSTTAGYRYRVLQTADITLPLWQEVKHSRAAGEPATLDFLEGSGTSETVYVDLPALGSAFFRLQMHEQ